MLSSRKRLVPSCGSFGWLGARGKAVWVWMVRCETPSCPGEELVSSAKDAHLSTGAFKPRIYLVPIASAAHLPREGDCTHTSFRPGYPVCGKQPPFSPETMPKNMCCALWFFLLCFFTIFCTSPLQRQGQTKLFHHQTLLFFNSESSLHTVLTQSWL